MRLRAVVTRSFVGADYSSGNIGAPLIVLGDACLDGDAEVHRVLTDKVFPRQAQAVTVERLADRLISLTLR